MEKTDLQKAWKTFDIIALGFVLLSILVILYFVRELLTPFIIAFVIAFFLNPIIDYMEGKGINRTLAILTLIILSVFVLLIILKLTSRIFQAEINNFKNNAPFYINKIQEGLNRGINLLEKNISFIPKGTYVPNKYFETFLVLFHKIDHQVSNYIRGQLIDTFIVGVLAIISLYLLRVNHSFLIGAVLGMVNVIPFIGPLMGLTFGSLLLLIGTGSTVNLIKFVGVYVCIRMLDDIIISPLALSKSVQVHTLVVIIVIMLGGFFHGILGMLLAVPLYCSIKVTLQILYGGLIEYGNW
jgi:predicted PurR-regulated permease PerM